MENAATGIPRIQDVFKAIAGRQPDAPAIIGDDTVISYGELDRQADTLADVLTAYGLATGEAVGVYADRSALLPLAFLAIARAGGVYVPLVANQPAARLADMAEQAEVRLVIALDGLDVPAALRAADGGTPTILRPESLPFSADQPRRPMGNTGADALPDLAAILFTSGSTGRPKGVMIRHEAVLNMAAGHIAAQAITAADRILLAAAPGFILGFRELCLPLMSGAACVPASRALLDDPARLLAAMSRHRVSVALFTPSYLRLLNGVVSDGLRCLLTAGERPNSADALHYARHVDYWNMHGATEVCGTICMIKVDPDRHTGALPSGAPFPNTAVHILDEAGRAVAPGEAGEIHVVGTGVSPGYLKQPDLTAQTFIDTPYGRAYRTGDIGRWNADGHLEALGRRHDSVKVSGQTVALGEIEQALLRHPGVSHAAVLQHDNRLVAFITGPGTGPGAQSAVDWPDFLRLSLPGYMIPARVLPLPRLPTNSAGKTDRQALLALAAAAGRGGDGAIPPRTPLEQAVADVWAAALETGPVMRDDNFFALGGTSLRAIDVSLRLQKLGHAATVQDILSGPTVAALADRLASRRTADGDDTPPPAQGTATVGQADFWVAAHLRLPPAGSHIVRVLALRDAAGTIPDVARWQRAWARLIAHHPALRTGFFADAAGTVNWRTRESVAESPLALDRCDNEQTATALVAAQAERPFDLTEPPLARGGLITLADSGETLFWLVLHHAVIDGISASQVQDDLLALLRDQPLPPAAHGIHLATDAERRYLASPAAVRDREHWRDLLDRAAARDGGAAFQEHPGDHHRPAAPSGHAAPPLTTRLDAATLTALTDLARHQRVGLHALLLALLGWEVHRRSGRAQVLIGSGVTLRPPGAETAIGHYINVLPLLLENGDDPAAPTLHRSLRDHVTAAQDGLTRGLAHAAYPVSLLTREFRQRHPHVRPASRTALFDITLTANPARAPRADDGLTLVPRRPADLGSHPAAGADLAFSYEPVGDGLDLILQWNPDLYHRATAQAWLDALAGWARWLAADPARADAPPPALLPAEVARLAELEYGPRRPRAPLAVHQIVADRVRRRPDAPAVVGRDAVLSYADLDAAAGRVAAALRERGLGTGGLTTGGLTAGPDQRQAVVAVLTGCSPGLPAVALGVWRAGAAYLPLPRELPAERLAYMAADAGAAILLVADAGEVPPALAAAFATILHADALPDAPAPETIPEAVAVSPDDIAYIIYTSGTTGRPKGVAVTHRGYVNAVLSHGEIVGLTPDDRVALVATPGFDASPWELGMALMHGAALVPVAHALRDDPWAMKRYYTEMGVTTAFHAPSYLRVSQDTPFQGLRILITGGEAPTHEDARHHAAHLDFWNCYGPTETAILISAHRVAPDADPTRPLPAGRPLPNARISLRHPDGTPVPPGAAGELWLAGDGLARGYLNNPDLTARAFVETAEGRFYRSGDLGRWTADGQIELLGRIDQQVKLHGQRLEPAEIEAALLDHPAVRQAAVLAEKRAEGGGESLILRAFVRLVDGTPAPGREDWRDWLAPRLPVHMIPATITPIPRIPVTPAGKIDARALLALAPAEADDGPRTAPGTAMESAVARVWRMLLGDTVPVRTPLIAREDDFFALGGNSLLAVTMAHRLSAELGLAVPARGLFATPTLAAFAARLDALRREAAPAPSAAVILEPDLATLGEEEFRVAEKAGLDTRHFIIPLVRVVTGTVPDAPAWKRAWTALVARHPALRCWFEEDADGRLWRRTLPPGGITATLAASAMAFTTLPDRAAALAHIRDQQDIPLSMGEAPLWRAGVVSLADGGQPLFWLALHHAVGDGQSVAVIERELTALLDGAALPPPTGDIRDRTTQEQRYLASGAAAADADYWRRTLAAVPDAAFDDWTLDHSRTAGTGSGSHRFQVRLDPATIGALKGLARRHNASLHALLLTLLAGEAHRRGGRDTVLLGSTVSTRDSAADVGIVGYAVNMLPLACTIHDRDSLGERLRATQAALAAALHHARHPFASIYRDLWRRRPDLRGQGRFPLFDIAVTENPDGAARRDAGATGLERLPPTAGPEADGLGYERTASSPGQDMVLIHEGLADGGLLLEWKVDAALYRQDSARAWIDALAGWARWLAADPARADAPPPALLPAEAARLAELEYGPRRPRAPLAVHQIVADWVRRRPDAPAVVGRDAVLSYADLDAAAGRVAAALRERGLGIGGLTTGGRTTGGLATGPDRQQAVVAVLTGCSPGLPAVALGVWRAGAAYLPLPRELPAERLAYMAADAGAAILLVADAGEVPPALAAAFATILHADALPDAPAPETIPEAVTVSPDDIAYIIYTSGTTGRPKGVAVTHRGYVNAVLSHGEIVGLTADDRVALVATPGFDASPWELGMALMHGAALVPVAHALRDDPWAMKRYYTEMGVTTAFHAPSYLRVSQDTPFQGLRVLTTGGEAPNHADAARYADRLELWNAYGPTETTIIITLGRLPPDLDPTRPLPAGLPLPNARISLRRPDGTPVPPGAAGELWLAGDGLARGYLNNPDLTAKAFVETAEGRFYRSGDLGRWTADGQIELLGRIDQQVKLHGQRLEPAEIEAALLDHPAVRQAAVLAEKRAEGGGESLILRAFVRLADGTPAPGREDWRDWLAPRLPVHMIPATITPVDHIPVTPAGKIDARALLALAPADIDAAARTAPGTAMESAVARVWRALLGDTVPVRAPLIAREDDFFALGGNSLLAVTMAHRLSAELGLAVPARDLFIAPTLAAFAARLDALRQTAAPAMPENKAPENTNGDDHPALPDLATVGEREFWVAEQAGLDTRHFTIPVVRLIRGPLPGAERWQAAWAALVARHTALRCRFGEDAEGRLWRRPLSAADAVEGAVEFATLPDRAAALAHIRQRQGTPLPLDRAPLWRLGVVTEADSGRHLFWLALHHAVGDGQSVEILAAELAALLRGETLPPLRGDIGDQAVREQRYLAGDAVADDARHWRETLAALPDAAFDDWTLDHPRNAAAATGSHRLEIRLSPARAQALKGLARRHNASLHALLLTLLAGEVLRRDGRTSMVLGSTATLRDGIEAAGLVGYAVNMLPLPCRVTDGESFGERLRATQAALAVALHHARLPFADLYHEFWRQRPGLRDPARYPLFDIVVTENPDGPAPRALAPDAFRLERLPQEGPALGEDAIAYERTANSPGQDMVLIHEALPDGGLALKWQMNAALYDRDTARQWLGGPGLGGLAGLAVWLADDPARADLPLPPLLPEETARLARWQRGAVRPRPALRLHELFERVADRPGQSERPAILGPRQPRSYGELDAAANAIAHALRIVGVESGAVAGVLTPRACPDLPAALLGVWKAGAVYLPLAADLPAERLAFMARDAGVKVLIALDGAPLPPALAAADLPLLRPDALAASFRAAHAHRLEPAASGDGPAYILYTSGSTGAPKGTRVGHAALVNTLLGVGEAFGLGPDDRTLMFASPSFDVSLSDIGLPLAFGAAVCPVPPEVVEQPRRFLELLRDQRITVADLTPTYLRLLDGADLPTLRILVTGGEAPLAADVRRYGARLRYVNAYGPTENAITSTMGDLPLAGMPEVLATGRPLPNTCVEIRDARGRLTPPGVRGEIWLGGAGLAEGYLKRPDLTAASFIDTPEGRRYRTGDLGRWRDGADGEESAQDGSGGVLELLGRIDQQVKLNGIRVEPGEIEAALENHPAIAQAVAVVAEAPMGNDGAGNAARQSLWAFVRLATDTDAAADAWLAGGWRDDLAARLPAYMIPAALIPVPAIPVGASGKVDKAALKALLADRALQAPATTGEAPQGPVETAVAAAWEAVLGCGPVSRDDDFFRLGGHSLLAIAVAHRLETVLGHPVPARELFAGPRLRDFARRIGQPSPAAPDIAAPTGTTPTRTTPTRTAAATDLATEGQREFWVAEQAGLDTRGFVIALALTVRGAVPEAARWHAAWAALVARHPALRSHFAEDEAGVLRRPVLSDEADTARSLTDAHFRFDTAPDTAAALAGAQSRMADPIAMAQAPLWRGGLTRIPDHQGRAEDGEAVFWLALHHGLGDGLSLAVLVEELTALLRGEALAPVAGDPARSAAREQAYLNGPAARVDSVYWRDTLAHMVQCGQGAAEGQGPFDEWPLDMPRPLGRTVKAARGCHSLRLRLEPAVADVLRRLAQTHGASLHALMLTLMAVEVRRRTGRRHFLLGTAASTRETADEARVVGYYVNMLPLACHLADAAAGAPVLADILAGVQHSLAEGLHHSRYPVSRILKEFRQDQPAACQPGRYPLFDITVTENPPAGDGGAGDGGADGGFRFGIPLPPTAAERVDGETVHYRLSPNAPAQDIVLAHEGHADGGLTLQWFVNAALYDRDTATAWAASLAALARHVATGATLARPVPALLPPEETRLAAWEQGPALPWPAPSLDVRFRQLAARQPDHPAIVTADGIQTYAAVAARAAILAHALRAAGVRRGDAVGVYTDRSATLPVVALAIWQAGGCYVPLSRDLPGERLAFIARDAGARVLLVLDGLDLPPALALPPAVDLRPAPGDDAPPTVLRPDAVWAVPAPAWETPPEVADRAPGDPAYILYTSGSTGAPKGVVLHHGGLMNLGVCVAALFQVRPDDRALLISSPTFDLWMSDLAMMWTAGGALVPTRKSDIEDIAGMRALQAGLGVTIATMAPSYLRLFEQADFPGLRILMTVGEPPLPVDALHYAGRLDYYNGYGPTENSAVSAIGLIRPGAERMTVGPALANIGIHILDAQGRRVPPGAIGEVWVSGVGLAVGYLNRPDLTKRAFIDTPEGRRYRTGDLGRWTGRGELLVLGRTDTQVKLRGQRVEPGEIEHTLETHPAVHQAVVLVDRTADGTASLWAFAALAAGAGSDHAAWLAGGWRDYLAERLPAYMVPAGLIPVPAIPVNLSGKVDKAALTALLADRADRAPSAAGEAPQGPVETAVAAAWEAVLGCGPVSRDDDFFRLGGQSLLAISLSHRLEKALGYPVPARELFADPSLRGFARRVGQLGLARRRDADAATDVATEGQREFWVAEQAGLDTRGFNIPLALTVRGAVPEAARWHAAWAALVARHPALRSHFAEDEAGVLRRPVLPADADTARALTDAHFHIGEAPDTAAALAEAQSRMGGAIPMAQAPLWRGGLTRIPDSQGQAEEDRAVFWLALHHAVGDGLSLAVLVAELTALLRGEALAPPDGDPARSAAREQDYLGGPAAQADSVYWQDTLAHMVQCGRGAAEGQGPFDEWPLDMPRPLGRTVKAARGCHNLRLRLEPAVADALRRLAQTHGASLHALMLTLMAVEVRRRTGRRHFLLGTAASTRETADEARVVGYYINMLPLACHLDGAAPLSLGDALAGVQHSLTEGLLHSRYPVGRILHEFRRAHPAVCQPGRYPLFDISVTENPAGVVTAADDASGFRFASPLAPASRAPSYRRGENSPAQDMVLTHESDGDGGLTLQWTVNAGLYDRDTAQAWLTSLAALARRVAVSGDAPLPDLLPEEEALLDAWEQGPALSWPARSLDARVADLAARHPDRPAIITATGGLSYGEVDRRATALAHVLRDLGVRPGVTVGVLTDRSATLPTAALAIWRAGGCYLPLTRDLPEDRLAFIAGDADARVILVLDGHEPPPSLSADGARALLRPETVWDGTGRRTGPVAADEPDADAPAYILYTSGSTGTPKGVVLTRGGLLNLGVGLGALFQVRPDDRGLLMASPSFDLWISDLVMMWTAGGALVPVSRAEMDDISGLRAALADRGVTIATMVPSYLRLFEQADFPGLRLLMTVGEPPIPADALHYAERLDYYNGYGPTENTAASAIGLIRPGAERMTVGHPLGNTGVHVLDPQGRRVPPGAIGEVWVSGAGLALGYLNRPDLSKRAFIEAPEGRRYRTGDLGRWTTRGELLVLGRGDSQVKLRGQRVELGEIEHALETHPAVRQAVALVDKAADGGVSLWAFATLHGNETEPDQEQWRAFLAAALPGYMVPAAVIAVPSIPTSLAGKVDRAALLAVLADRGAPLDGGGTADSGTPPQGPVESRIAAIWAEQLQRPTIRREDHFFELGGDSLRATAMVNRVRREFSCKINDLYENPRLADFARLCRPQPGHLSTMIAACRRHWQDYQDRLPSYEAARDAAMTAALRDYAARNAAYDGRDYGARRDYDAVLLTGATGYLGAYLLRDLLRDPARRVTALVRGGDDAQAAARLRGVLAHYFGDGAASALMDGGRLTVLGGDLRRPDLGLSARRHAQVTAATRAIIHCAANVNHYGHYRDSHADNVLATRHLLDLAAARGRGTGDTADMHFVSTLSVCGKPPEDGFRLFTEYDPAPAVPDDNYYVRSKQEAEALVAAARGGLANASIHRVGNVVFATDGAALQRNLRNNAFFRLTSALVRLGLVPGDMHAWLCHVDQVARALTLLAGAACLGNETHHLEHARRDTLADVLRGTPGIGATIDGGDYAALLDRLTVAAGDPAMDGAMAELLNAFGIYRGESPQERDRRMEIASGRTQTLLNRLGFSWPADIPLAGRLAMMEAAAALYA